MHMVRHDHPGQHPVPVPVKHQQGTLHKKGGVGPPQDARTVAGVRKFLQRLSALRIPLFLRQKQEFPQGNRTKNSQCHEDFP